MQRRLGSAQHTALIGGGLLLFSAAIFVSGQQIKAREAAPAFSVGDAVSETSDEDAAAMAEAAGIVDQDPAPTDDGGAVVFLDPAEEVASAATQPAAVDENWTEKLLYRPVPTAAGLLQAQGYNIELDGLTPLDPDERCTGSDGREWFCGAAARTQFRNFLRGRALSCAVPDEAPAAPVVTRCTVGGEDLGTWLAAQGWAHAEEGGPLAQLGEKAREAEHGIYGNKPALPPVVIEPGSAAPPPSFTGPALVAPNRTAPLREGNFPPPPSLPSQ
ncbi:thermonuclease family protein [Tianweitania sediminis]|uniref:Thermonuclease family protein n=1 Tax=Tianweitania sediminis TaxID=1502156 RepID=A0A8J7UH44_9HYPH|nr:thermonuclease family protein [Tianweitania sediminis]MBP0437388.1 thermonuclease family protein [Tianweitania sediminis]